METTVIIPTYWTNRTHQPGKRPNPLAVYDHPTSISESGTLSRLLGSLKNLKDYGTHVPKIIVLTAVVHDNLERKAEKKVESIITAYRETLDVTSLSVSDLNVLKSNLTDKGLTKFAALLSLKGYSNIRNTGLVVAQILGSDAVIFLDDDEVITDLKFFQKCGEFIGKSYGEKIIGGVTGYYVNSAGSYLLPTDPKEWWKTGWKKRRQMNEAFKIIDSSFRVNDTPFAFGGCMVISQKLLEKVPFDPYITRGEDMDMLVNAKMFDFAFLLDNQLQVVHLPEYTANRWQEMRQDLYRFAYMRRKIRHPNREVTPLQIKMLMPYPGYFLQKNLTPKFFMSSFLSLFRSTFKPDRKEFIEYLINMKLSFSDIYRYVINKQGLYFKVQQQWAKAMPSIKEDSSLNDRLKKSRHRSG